MLRRLAMTEMRDVIARWLLSVVEINEAIHTVPVIARNEAIQKIIKLVIHYKNKKLC